MVCGRQEREEVSTRNNCKMPARVSMLCKRTKCGGVGSNVYNAQQS